MREVRLLAQFVQVIVPPTLSLCGAVFAVAIGLAPGTAIAQSWLVTEEEAAQSRALGEPLAPRFVPERDAPVIEVVEPDVTQPVVSPTRIRLRFTSTPPSAIVAGTFKARYGALGIDITSRLLEVARVAVTGIDVPAANLPKGSHRIRITIADSVGRVGEQQIAFTVR